ncbi:Vgb family protein [Halopseudomonas maritima]|uniref:Vgb family protein n=1 Tax=Halopseudomonas maritima TaxID=2918528 RepID=UPI001EEB701B|nr:SMP-30/gluconolactonase/LRE family protein [Halopseudomonas maritima]UJJ31172.1 SMP-30/gluconolactonase/LRE family protein [Halopseudomonas maritima]
MTLRLRTLTFAGLFSLAPLALATHYSAPEQLVAPSPFKGIHGLAVDKQGRLLAGSVVGASLYEVDTDSGDVQTLIGPNDGQADDIAIGPNGEMAWTGFYSGRVLYRENDDAPIQVLASDLPGINSLDFNDETGALYASQVFLGDALWEVDRTGAEPPRLIGKDLGGFNGFEVGADGWLYGPLWFKGQIVRINPAGGELQVISSDFKTPAAANFDSKGNLYAIDTFSGQLKQVNLADGSTELIAQLDSALDNLALDADDNIYVSNMANNRITRINPQTREQRRLVNGDLAVPAGLALSEDGKTLYVADVFALRAVDTASGKVTDLRRAHGSDAEYPINVALGRERLLVTSFSTGTLQLISRSDNSTLAMVHQLKAPSAAVELDDGSVLVSELASGRLLRLSGPDLAERSEVASGLQGPVQMIKGPSGKIYLTLLSGQLARLDVSDFSLSVIAEGLQLPEGLTELPDGRLLVAEPTAQRLLSIDPQSGAKEVVAEHLPIGLPAGPGMPPTGIPTGLAADAEGRVYFASDLDNGLYRLTAE